MRPGRASETAVLVCMARALAHGTTPIRQFSDPTALSLLPDDAKARFEQLRSAAAAGAPTSARTRLRRILMDRRMKMMVARTVAIDEDVRGAKARQVVILGAGLDGRAWRMPELRDAVVFEVDHPDSQRDKRAQTGALSQQAREVRFLPVDFAKDDLAQALAAAGHDTSSPTMWIWEGVVMYLTPAEVEATLAIVAKRSAPGSRLSVLYHRRAPISILVGFLLRRLGEPLRSSYSAPEMAALLAKHGFDVVRDASLPDLGGLLSPELAKELRAMNHLRLATADRPQAPSRA